MSESDESLVRRTLGGQLEAFGVLVERYSGLVHALILDRTRCYDEVDDLVQETFCTAYQALSGLRHPARFGPWLTQVARTTVLHWARREGSRSRAEVGSEEWLPGPGIAPDEDLERRERAETLWQALDQLPEDLRQLVLLHHLEGCTHRELAHLLGVSTATTHWRLLRAERQLSRQVIKLLGEGIRVPRLDPRRTSRRVLAGLATVGALVPRTEAALLPWWSGVQLLALVKASGPAVGGVGLVLGVVAYLGGFSLLPPADSTVGSAPASELVTGPRVRLGTYIPGRGLDHDSTWAMPPAPPDAGPLDRLGLADRWMPPPQAPAWLLLSPDELPPVHKPTGRMTESWPGGLVDPVLVVTAVRYRGADPQRDAFSRALPALAEYLRQEDDLGVRLRWRTMSLDTPGIGESGLLYLTGHDARMQLSDAEKRTLGRYLRRGGLLFAEDICHSDAATGLQGKGAGMPGTPFDLQLKALMCDPLVLGVEGEAWEQVPADHPIFASRHRFVSGPPRGGSPGGQVVHLEMLRVRGRTAVIFSDLNLSWYWGDPRATRPEEGLRFGANLVAYAFDRQAHRPPAPRPHAMGMTER